ncbi:hypothetical protein Trydic_g12895 [Trypoxylus dichotomus]
MVLAIGHDISELKAATVSLKCEILDLKSRLTAPASTLSEDYFEDFVQEINEGERRKCSLVVHDETNPSTSVNDSEYGTITTILDTLSYRNSFLLSQLGKCESLQ